MEFSILVVTENVNAASETQLNTSLKRRFNIYCIFEYFKLSKIEFEIKWKSKTRCFPGMFTHLLFCQQIHKNSNVFERVFE